MDTVIPPFTYPQSRFILSALNVCLCLCVSVCLFVVNVHPFDGLGDGRKKSGRSLNLASTKSPLRECKFRRNRAPPDYVGKSTCQVSQCARFRCGLQYNVGARCIDMIRLPGSCLRGESTARRPEFPPITGGR